MLLHQSNGTLTDFRRKFVVLAHGSIFSKVGASSKLGAIQFEQSPARALAVTLKSWLEPIVRMWRFTKSNGITEGFHTKMEMISRRAYGFRNFENYRLRVLALCGWDGVMHRT